MQSIPVETPKDPLLQPFTLKGLTLRNRVISTAHASAMDDGGMPAERYRAYHVEKARGGLAMTMIGGSAMVSRDSSWGAGQVNLSTDAVIPHLAKLAEAIHAEGAAVMTQISHLGRRAQFATGDWLPVLAPSRLREQRNRSFPREMTREDIDRILDDFENAARRVADAGLDGLETLTGGHLIGQFLSPMMNTRTDGFGGSLENRMRFAFMVHERIRRAVGDAMPVGIRLVVDEGIDGGLRLDDCIEIAQAFEREGTVDFFNCIYGRMESDLVLSEDNMPGMFQKSAPYLGSVAAFRMEVSLPLLHAGGIRDVATARHVLRADLVDLVGMTRAHLADPHLVQKLRAGREDEIRPCVGASYCLLRKSHCVHNPATTRELKLGHDIPKAAQPGKVVVVGGGPAGMEAARVASLRGHQVVLFEAAPQLGGQLRLATRVRERADLQGIIYWRDNSLYAQEVDVRLNTYADESDILAEQPDTVILATGGVPDLDWLEGAEHCLSTWDILSQPTPAASSVLIYDATGRQAAASCVLELAREGREITFATPDDATVIEMPYQDRSGFRKHFAELGVSQLTDTRLIAVHRKGRTLEAVFQNTYSGAEFTRTAGVVVVEHGTQPMDDLFDALREASSNKGFTDPDILTRRADNSAPLGGKNGFALHRIGDAVSSRDLHAAILDGYRLARLI
ncbi:NADH:flavin oxidoreductase [Donghicola mangrovi]|uniref:NADH:flavin oxidoreductase n=1 Tax=Donghicola mangrovi TaxID=2729614 RepID=A0A850Q9Y3_9RHOB|nr:NADH:flavin oxidoreductase [Donghicola mangrovi]NVO23295.1 NADH:flavin oxidoreductase [Donghicola mangrovi]